MEITRQQAEIKLMPISNKCTNNNGIVVFLPTSNEYVVMNHGEGESLTTDDYKAGFNDYIYISSYICTSTGFEETNGGYFLFNYNDYQNDRYRITNFVFDCIWLISESEKDEFIPDFIPLHLL